MSELPRVLGALDGGPASWEPSSSAPVTGAVAATCKYRSVGKNERAKIVMTADEIAEFIEHSRTATLATVLPDGRPHLVAMWYAVLDGELWFETKAKSQKAVNLRRDPTITVMIEAGDTYDTLRGVSIDGTAELVDDPDLLLRVGISVWERYTGPYTDDMRPFVDQMMNNRIAVRVVPGRLRSWDHGKLGLPELPVSGSTAQYLR